MEYPVALNTKKKGVEMALPVDLSQTHALNLQVLQRQDSQIAEIVGTASHVVVYEFDQVEQSWVK